MRAHRRERVDRALEAVERVGFSGDHDLEALVVVVTADFAAGHGDTSVAEERLLAKSRAQALYFSPSAPVARHVVVVVRFRPNFRAIAASELIDRAGGRALELILGEA